jgi:hypothetical protein
VLLRILLGKTIFFAYRAITFYGQTFQSGSAKDYPTILQSYNPNNAETLLVWAVPRSLATTEGITIVFSSSAYLDVSVRQVSLP